MKNIKIILLIGVLMTGYCGCGPDMIKLNPKFETYRIINESSHSVRIIPYDRFGSRMEENVLNIKAHDSVEIKRRRVLPPRPVGLTVAIAQSGYLSKIIITFDKKQRIVYIPCENMSCDNPKNLFDKKYSVLSNYEIFYIITEDDFKNAEACNGACE